MDPAATIPIAVAITSRRSSRECPVLGDCRRCIPVSVLLDHSESCPAVAIAAAARRGWPPMERLARMGARCLGGGRTWRLSRSRSLCLLGRYPAAGDARHAQEGSRPHTARISAPARPASPRAKTAARIYSAVRTGLVWIPPSVGQRLVQRAHSYGEHGMPHALDSGDRKLLIVAGV